MSTERTPLFSPNYLQGFRDGSTGKTFRGKSPDYPDGYTTGWAAFAAGLFSAVKSNLEKCNDSIQECDTPAESCDSVSDTPYVSPCRINRSANNLIDFARRSGCTIEIVLRDTVIIRGTDGLYIHVDFENEERLERAWSVLIGYNCGRHGTFPDLSNYLKKPTPTESTKPKFGQLNFEQFLALAVACECSCEEMDQAGIDGIMFTSGPLAGTFVRHDQDFQETVTFLIGYYKGKTGKWFIGEKA